MTEPDEQCVYFAVSGKEVKIGVSNKPRQRIKGMQTARPDIELLAAVPGGIETEVYLHQRFQKFRITGEWFHFAPGIQEFVKEQLSYKAALKPIEEEFFTRKELCQRWQKSAKTISRAEERLGLQPYRFLRDIRYRLSDILRIEAGESNKALLRESRREQEELS